MWYCLTVPSSTLSLSCCCAGYAAAVIAATGASLATYLWSCSRDPGYVFPRRRLLQDHHYQDDQQGSRADADEQKHDLAADSGESDAEQASAAPSAVLDLTSATTNTPRDGKSTITGKMTGSVTTGGDGSTSTATVALPAPTPTPAAFLKKLPPPSHPVGKELAAGHSDRVCLLCAAVYPPSVQAPPAASAVPLPLTLAESDHVAKHCKKCNRYGIVALFVSPLRTLRRKVQVWIS